MKSKEDSDEEEKQEKQLNLTAEMIHATDGVKHISGCIFILIIQLSLISLVFDQFTNDSYSI